MSAAFDINRPLPVQPEGFNEMGDPTGLASRGHTVIYNDFEDGPQNWGSLYVQNETNRLPMFWIKDRHKARLEMRGADVSGLKGMMIRRTTHMHGYGYYLAEFLMALHSSDVSDPRTVSLPARLDVGLDTCQADGTRNYFALRYAPNDGTNAANTFNIQYNTSSFHQCGSEFVWPVNEQKVLPVYLAMLVNTSTGKYHGIRVNDQIKSGYFASPPDTSLSDLARANGASLPRFASGLNPFVDMAQQTGSSYVEATCEMTGFRLTYLGETLS